MKNLKIENLRELEMKQLSPLQELGCMAVIGGVVAMLILWFVGIIVITEKLLAWVNSI